MRKTWTWVLIIAALGSILYGAYVFTEEGAIFQQEKVKLELQGNKKFSWGKEATLKLTLKNNNEITLKNVQVDFSLPSYYRPIRPQDNQVEFDKVPAHTTKKIALKFKPYGKTNQTQTIETELGYTPENTTSRFNKKIFTKTKVTETPLKIKVQKNESITPGSQIKYPVKISNSSARTIRGLKLKIESLQGLKKIDFTPPPDIFPKTWSIGKLGPHQQKAVILEGITKKEKQLAFTTVVYKQKNQNTLLSTKRKFSQFIGKKPIILSHKIKGQKPPYSVKTSEGVNFQISAKNTTNSSLNNLSLQTRLKGGILDPDSVEITGAGSYNPNQKIINWGKESDFSFDKLGPKKEITLNFNFNLKKDITTPIKDKKLRLKTYVKSSDPQEDLHENIISTQTATEIKLETDITLHSSFINLSGPSIPKRDERSTFKIQWKLLNSYNNVRDLTVTTILPQNVNWEGKASPNYETITFDQNTRKVTWKIDNLLQQTGWNSPVREGSFKVSIEPEANKSQYYLTGESTARGEDEFTHTKVKAYEKSLWLEN